MVMGLLAGTIYSVQSIFQIEKIPVPLNFSMCLKEGRKDGNGRRKEGNKHLLHTFSVLKDARHCHYLINTNSFFPQEFPE